MPDSQSTARHTHFECLKCGDLNKITADLLAALEHLLETSAGPTQLMGETSTDYAAASHAYASAVIDAVAAIRKARGQ